MDKSAGPKPATRLESEELTEDQICVIYLRQRYSMGVHSIAEALKMSAADVERTEREAYMRMRALQRKPNRPQELSITIH